MFNFCALNAHIFIVYDFLNDIMKEIVEGKAVLVGAGGKNGDVPKRNEDVFYNPAMKHQRDVLVAVVNSYKSFPGNGRELHVGLSMEASGVRSIRLLKECAGRKLLVHANDYNEDVVKSMRANFKLNNVSVAGVTNLTSDAFFERGKGFDIIDLDPFGTPGPYLDMAVKRLSRGGLLCVTATDSAVLCGLYPSVALRSYWSATSHDMSMHEWAVRILVRYCQLIGAQYDRALIPVLCYKKDHYVRLYLRCDKSKEKATVVVASHSSFFVNCKSGEISLKQKKGFDLAGPMYTGALVDLSLFDEKVFRKYASDDSWVDRLFAMSNVSKQNILGYYTIPLLCSYHNVKVQPSVDGVIDALVKKGFIAYVSLDEPQSIKSDCSYNEFVSVLKKVKKR